MSKKTPPPDERLWWWLQAVLIAKERFAAAKREKRKRIDRARAWMAEWPLRRTIGEANAHVGMGSADEDVKGARHALDEALDALVEKAPAMLAALGRTERD